MKRLLDKLFKEDNVEVAEAFIEDVDDRVKDDGAVEIIIVSDNHGSTVELSKVLNYHVNSDYFLHCGDSNLKPTHALMKPFIAVKGNTDYSLAYQENEFFELEIGERILITHGHLFFVGLEEKRLLAYANSLDKVPNIIFYGHTHRIDVKILDGFLVINPGSLCEPRDEHPPSYAKLRILPEAYHVQILESSDFSIIKEFQFPRESSHLNLGLE